MLNKTMRIDPHVHCRDGKQKYKETIRHVLEIAKAQGVAKIFDMSNTDPPITAEKHITRRLKLVPKRRINDYYIWIGVTANEDQLAEAVECFRNYKNVIGLKMFAGKSVGDLTVLEKEDQKKVYATLKNLNFDGVIAVHCEKESFLKNELWNPKNSITHSQARPNEAEVESVKDQIELIRETGFQGTFHVCHVSCPESVALIEGARMEINPAPQAEKQNSANGIRTEKNNDLRCGARITCGVTPHHILWTDEMLNRPDGLLYKMNPPLRNKESVEGLRKYLVEGKIDWIETDHAPHQVGEKMFEPYMSGYPSLCLYKDFVENFLPGIGMSEELIKKMTSENIYKVFGDKLK